MCGIAGSYGWARGYRAALAAGVGGIDASRSGPIVLRSEPGLGEVGHSSAGGVGS